jgi:hypothetical protein
MSVDDWLKMVRADAERRGLTGTVPVLEAFARAMRILREAPWNEAAGPADETERSRRGA